MSIFHSTIIPLIIGFTLDTILGDPYWLPHPIRLFGKSIDFLNKQLNKGNNKKLKGLLTVTTLVSFTYIIFYLIIDFTKNNITTYNLISGIFVFYGLANRSLIKEVLKVEHKLTTQGIEVARKQLSYIVGRETSILSKNKIRIALLETLSENLSDGVIAPIFYYAIGGVPLMFTYKMINTLDSMIGYKKKQYKHFGYFAAKLDDIANYLPARITALLMATITFSKRSFIFIIKYGNKHTSPNAGYPEAALAGILNCQFGGKNIYHGVEINKPIIGNNDRTINKEDIKKSCFINFFTTILVIVLVIILILLVHI